MWNKIKFWYNDNYSQITWFIIGWFSLDVIVRVGRGEWSDAALSLALVIVNYLFVRRS